MSQIEKFLVDALPKLVDDKKPNLEIKLSTNLQNCRVEITGSDYYLLQRLLKKLNH